MNNPQQIAELIRVQTTLKKISIRQMLKDIGLGVNSLSHMDNGSMPKADNLGKVADYLGCSVDYLLGRTDTPEISSGNTTVISDIPEPTDKTTAEFLQIFQSLDISDRIAVMNLAIEKSKNSKS